MIRFTEHLWSHIRPLYDTILDHPFIRELAAGTLPVETFIFYMKQDVLYLVDFTRALSLAAARSSDVDAMKAFLEFASGAVVVERALHETYFKQYDVTLDVEKAPACFAYTNYLLATSLLRSHAESIAALLPCFWIYREVGMHVYETTRPGNGYIDWINTYAGKEFHESVERAIAITDRVAAEATAAQRDDMVNAFETSSRLEWLFWDSAYRREPWLPALPKPKTNAGRAAQANQADEAA